MVVDALMTPDPVVLRHDDTTAIALHKMAVGGFRHIPIVEDDRVVGLSRPAFSFSAGERKIMNHFMVRKSFVESCIPDNQPTEKFAQATNSNRLAGLTGIILWR